MDLKDGAEVGLGAFALGLLQAAIAWVTTRSKLRRSPPAETTNADAALTEAAAAFVEKLGASWSTHTDALRDEIRDLNHKLDRLEGDLEKCHEGHARQAEEIAQLRDRLGLKAVAETLPLFPSR